MDPDQLPPHPTATFVLPAWKTVYVSVPKAACTSLKWLVADLQGEDPEHFYGALSRETGRSMTVHHRALWQRTPMLSELTEQELAQVHPDNGWFVFGVTRHPATRLWSGWQSKLLLREPRFLDKYPEADWPALPSSSEDVVQAFTSFVRGLRSRPDQALLRDRHFRRQVDLLAPRRLPYTRLYRTSDMPQLLADLEAHLRPLGLDALPALRRSNETPLQPLPELFDEEVRATVAELYAQDLSRFGYDDPTPDVRTPRGSRYTGEQLAEVGRLVERGERIGDLYRLAKDLQQRLRAAEREPSVSRRSGARAAVRAVALRVRRASRAVAAGAARP